MSDIVHCHSEFRYAERPVSFNYAGQTYQIRQLLAQWKTDSGYRFVILTEEKSLYQLLYDEQVETWQIEPINLSKER
jgi:hypothetical protein